ncbi:23S rRNA (uracil(1939)-C(5))-methyltransferase RlmD [Thermodesulfobacteriota bacterium]
MKNRKHITIEKIIAGGAGFGHLADGRVVLTPYVLPGEEVSITIVKKHKDYAEARLQEVISPSQHRVTPRCPHFTHCGGCDLQHAETDYQLGIKDAILRELLTRSGLVLPGDPGRVIQPPAASPTPFEYRQRIRLQVDRQTRKWGYFQTRSHTVEPIEQCPLARPTINATLDRIRTNPHFQALLKQAEGFELIENPGSGRILLLLHSLRKLRPADRKHAETVLTEHENLQNILFKAPDQALLKVRDSEADKLLNFVIPASDRLACRLDMTLEAGGFCQVNQAQNLNLINMLLEWTEPGSGDRILDLFCGMGNFSLPLATHAQEVLGMDLQRAAIRSAKRNRTLAGLENCNFEQFTALDGIQNINRRGETFDIILLDPPRSGCREVIPHLAATQARTIIYISCNPSTLSRDLKELRETGYHLDRIRLVDMFPQTHHMEVITRLVRE